MNIHFGCGCGCPVMLPIAEEIHNLEDHKKTLQDQLEAIEKKISALKSVKES
jgi:hypothetical protein